MTKKGGGKPIGLNAGAIYDGSNHGWTPRLSLYGEKSGFYFRVSAATLNAKDLKPPKSQKYYHTAHRRQYHSTKLGYQWDGGDLDLALSSYRGKREI
ncbi:MAG: hypothetical protein LBE01_01985, partial [Deltaproteobacteria bacterium]|nr:hypothetical protein [Deltaproteobacteria bacterium]